MRLALCNVKWMQRDRWAGIPIPMQKAIKFESVGEDNESIDSMPIVVWSEMGVASGFLLKMRVN